MKKVKIMMTAIGVLAIVGGALAFKARTFQQDFCIKTLDGGPDKCTGFYHGRINSGAGVFYYTTLTTNTLACKDADCPISTRLSNVEP